MKLSKDILLFLSTLEKNNNREWFTENKAHFKEIEGKVKSFYNYLAENMKEHDDIEKLKMFRIYRDVRFSKDKTPYKAHFAGSMSRNGAQLRGGYYLQIKPKATFIAAGFWQPNKEDLFRIRKELELDASDFKAVIEDSAFKKIWGTLEGEEVKTAPKGFNKLDPNIALIRKKGYIFTKHYSDKEVLDPGFAQEVSSAFRKMRPFFDLMSEILTTNLNGESLLD